MTPRGTRRRAESSADHPKTNVRADLQTLVGREADRIAIDDFFAGGARLVTVTGLGGMGKTRLATQYAVERAADFSAHGGGGAWLCDLTPAITPMGAHGVVASVLGVAVEGGDDERMARSLGAALARRKRVLVVLDNFEQLSPHAEGTVGCWMREAPHARFLVTSRVALGIAGEQQWALSPLTLPSEDERDAEAIGRTEAVDLFVRRARALRPRLSLDSAELCAVAEIVRRLDGIPLAIELAAARMSVLSASQLLLRLTRQLDLLVRSSQEAGRHGSMRRTIEDSLSQLGEPEQRCLARLSVFHSGFTLDAAETVVSEPGRSALAAIEALVAHSLLRVGPSEGPGDELRFSLFEAIREVARERLETLGEQAIVSARHARYFADAALDWRSGAPQRVSAEVDNLIAAHDQSRADPSAEGAARTFALASVLAPHFATRGLFRQQLRLLDEALAANGRPLASTEAVGWTLWARAQAQRDLGARAAAKADLEEALRLARESNDHGLAAAALARLGELIETDGRTVEARELLAAALAEEEQAGVGASPKRRAEIHCRLAHAHRREGTLDGAELEIRQAIALYRAAGDTEGLALALYEAAVVSMFHRRYTEAQARFDEALAIVRTNGARQAEGALLSGLAVLLQEQGKLDESIDVYRGAVAIFREIGNPHREASALYYLGAAYLERWQLSDARRVLEQGRLVVAPVGAPRYEALLEGCLAVLSSILGDDEEARRQLVAADRSAESCRSERTLAATLAVWRATVDVAAGRLAYDSALERARELALRHPSDDVRYALRLLERAKARRDGVGQSEAAFVVRSGGRGFRLPGARSDVDLTRRVPLQRILLALAERRLAAPGEGLDLEEIVAAGWPGERITERAAHNRVHVALTTLRKLGLRDQLTSEAGGYALRPVGAFVLE